MRSPKDTAEVAWYARRLGYSSRTLSWATHEAVGRSAKQFIDDRAVLEAKRLLAHTDITIIPAAVEELLRYVIISGSGYVPLARVTREDVCLGGVTIPAGETALPTFNVANRDPRRLTTRTGLTWDVYPGPTWASARAPITASARSSPGWSCRRRSTGCGPTASRAPGLATSTC